MTDLNELDQKRIEDLSVALLREIRANYRLGPVSRDRVYEALNALAFATATVLQGARSTNLDVDELYNFWQRALQMQLADLERNPPVRTQLTEMFGMATI